MYWPFCCIPQRATSKPKLNRTASYGTQTSRAHHADINELPLEDQILFNSQIHPTKQPPNSSRRHPLPAHSINSEILDPSFGANIQFTYPDSEFYPEMTSRDMQKLESEFLTPVITKREPVSVLKALDQKNLGSSDMISLKTCEIGSTMKENVFSIKGSDLHQRLDGLFESDNFIGESGQNLVRIRRVDDKLKIDLQKGLPSLELLSEKITGDENTANGKSRARGDSNEKTLSKYGRTERSISSLENLEERKCMGTDRTEKKLEKVFNKSKNVSKNSASGSKNSEKVSRAPTPNQKFSFANESKSNSAKNDFGTPTKDQKFCDEFQTPKKNRDIQTPSKNYRESTPDKWTPSKYLRTRTIKDDIAIDARPNSSNLLTIEDKAYIKEHLTRNSRMHSKNITPSRTRLLEIGEKSAYQESRARTLSKKSEKSENSVEKVPGDMPIREKKRYPNILKYLDDPSYVNKPQPAPKSRVRRPRHHKSDGKNREGVDNLADKSKLRKKKRHTKRQMLRDGSTDTPNDIEVHAENPDYSPFRTSLNKGNVKRQWPGSQKNIQVLKFNKGFTIRGAKIDPKAKITMSPLTLNRFSAFGSPLKPIGEVLEDKV